MSPVVSSCALDVLSAPCSVSAETLFRSGTPVESWQAPSRAADPRSAAMYRFIYGVVASNRGSAYQLATTEKNTLRLGGYGVTSWKRPTAWFEKFDTSGSY